MIQANDLRKCNLVYFEKPVHVQLGDIVDLKNKIVSLSTYGIHLIEADENTKVNPIPLTEDILLKCGFSKWINETYEIRKNLDDTFTLYAWGSGVSIFIAHFSFLHTFQNLYFALTGTELEIKL